MAVNDKRETVPATSINDQRTEAGFQKLTDSYVLNNGVEIPVVGFGTWQISDGDDAYNSVRVALETGYRHIDTAAGYGNEESVGRAIADSGIAREELFVTTKLRNSDRGYDVTKAAFEESMAKLGLDYLDLWLIHWPNPITSRANWAEANAASWRAFEEFYEAGRLRALGISNFRPHHIAALLETARIVPQVNQIRICPGDVHAETYEACRRHDILLEAYSPLGTGKIGEIELLATIGKKYGKTAAQIALIWSLERGFLPLPKSVTPARIRENAALFDVRLTAEEMEQINQLDGIIGKATDPDTITW